MSSRSGPATTFLRGLTDVATRGRKVESRARRQTLEVLPSRASLGCAHRKGTTRALPHLL